MRPQALRSIGSGVVGVLWRSFGAAVLIGEDRNGGFLLLLRSFFVFAAYMIRAPHRAGMSLIRGAEVRPERPLLGQGLGRSEHDECGRAVGPAPGFGSNQF